MTEWQTIDTAPRDGTVIDIWMTDESGGGWREPDAYYVTDREETVIQYAEDGSYARVSRRRDGWWAPNHDYDGDDGWCDVPEHFNPHPNQRKTFYTRPTHWMPRPVAP